MVTHCRHLKVLSIPGGRVGGQHLNKKMKQLWSIDLEPLLNVMKNHKNDKSTKESEQPPGMVELDISSNALMDSHLQILFSSLRENKSLRKLKWQGNDSTFQSVRNLSHLLHVNHVLTDVGDFMQSINDDSQHARDTVSHINEKISSNAKALGMLRKRNKLRKN